MHIIICGGGRMSISLAQELAAEKHDVVIIEKDPEKAEELSESVNATIIEGNATDAKILEEAGLEKADIVVSLSPNESENLLVCMNAKKRKTCKTAARIERGESEETFRNLGIDTVIYPEKAVAHYLEELITKPEVVDLAFIGRGAAAILEFEIGTDCKVRGKKIKEIEYPKGSLIIAVYEGERLIIPNPNSVLSTGDKVLVLSTNKVMNRVRKLFA
jgi:trk system potassium uptake protein TrkA